ncbi:protein translocase subunit SecF [Microlunatus flavus]|uniref:Protein-export membrane protein SecF n=1 Tax=Microlunatus flavus TaxID=1036181 RepID=A0A1H9FCB9_9ACTN|nr:protein translocase subunit SecF [Microlunatus flavus]SEQ35601.1 preprotein translocase subunit SecF [Microlunatus flavus]
MSKFSQLGHRLYTGEVSYDFIGRRRRWYVLSGILLGISILAILLKGLTLGIEFEGGADFQAPTTVTAQTKQVVTDAVERAGVQDLGEITVSTIGSNQVRVQTRTLNTTTEVPEVRTAIGQAVGVPGDQVNYSLIGASWGGQITERALIALVVFLVLVTLVIWIYFRDAKMSGAALVALLHDLLLTVGIYALVGFTVTPATLIGVLTILGYSLYDTVVVFDKVRENVRGVRTSTTKTYSEASNLAVNQVLVRSINTTVIGVLPVAALLFAGTAILGEGPLKDLALALFVGMISGAYSSIFIATPLLAQLKEREPDMRRHRARVENRRGKAEAKTAGGVELLDSAGGSDDRVAEPEGLVGVDPAEPAAVAVGSRGGTRITTVSPEARSVRPVVEGAAKRPQPQSSTRSQRKK